MGFGSTAKKLQSVVDMADELYSKIGELRDQVNAMRETIETTNDRVGAIETELEDQRAILEAIAEAEDVELPADVGDETTVDSEATVDGEEADTDDGEVPDDETESAEESPSDDES